MRAFFEKDLGKELPVITRVVVGSLLAIVGLMVSALWLITGDWLIGIFGAAMGFPCVFVGVGIAVGNRAQTSLSPSGVKAVAIIFVLVGFSAIDQGLPYAWCAWAFAGACFKVAKNKEASAS